MGPEPGGYLHVGVKEEELLAWTVVGHALKRTQEGLVWACDEE